MWSQAAAPQRGRGEMWSHLATRAIHAPGRAVWRGVHEVCRHSGSQGAPLRAREGRRQGYPGRRLSGNRTGVELRETNRSSTPVNPSTPLTRREFQRLRVVAHNADVADEPPRNGTLLRSSARVPRGASISARVTSIHHRLGPNQGPMQSRLPRPVRLLYGKPSRSRVSPTRSTAPPTTSQGGHSDSLAR
jgi:hypothetical protein